jgi:UDP-N-acetylglucosamine transferase subunit ALG13
LEELDLLIKCGKINESVFAQTGYSSYKPHNYNYCKFLDQQSFRKNIKSSSLVITHGGTGAIITALKDEKKVIAVPRKKEYGEHIDNHQIEIVKKFANMNIIEPCYNVEDLGEAYDKVNKSRFIKYKSSNSKYIEYISNFLEKNL